MKKKSVLVLLAMVTAFGTSACGTKKLELTTNQIEVELGSELDTAVTSYVADADVASEAAIDFSAVDITRIGTYSATVTYKDQTADFGVVVVDTTAPEVTVAERVVVAAGEPLYAEDVITGVTELSGEVEVAFSEPDVESEGTETVEETETDDGTEAVENTEMVDEPTEEVEDAETTEAAEDTESTDASAGTAEPEAEFVLNDVICSNAYVIYPETGEYDNTLTVTDASGNSTEVSVHIVVGDAPEFSGIENITVTVGTVADEIDYLDGVTATDSNGNDITANIVCDSASVDLAAAGEYEITYTVTDENGFAATKTATVTVEEKNGKKSDTAKTSTSGKTDAKTDTSATNNSSSSNNSNAASTGTSGNSNTSNVSGNDGNSNNGGSSNSGNNNQTSNGTSGGNNTSGDSSNSGNAGNTSTPSMDTSGSTTTPTTPSTDTGSTSTPSTPSTDTGSSDGGMSVPDDVGQYELPDSMLDNTGTGGTDGGNVTDVGTN